MSSSLSHKIALFAAVLAAGSPALAALSVSRLKSFQ